MNFILKPFTFGLFVIFLMLSFSLALRQHEFSRTVGAQNLEATYHVLLTINALDESSAQDHWYLPTVTLGNDRDKYIAWGATIPTPTGDYIYTSFTPPVFLLPHIVFKLFNVAPSIHNLAYFNFALGAITSILIFVLLFQLCIFNGHGPWVSTGGALLGSTIGILVAKRCYPMELFTGARAYINLS